MKQTWVLMVAVSPKASDSQSEPFGLAVRRDGLFHWCVISDADFLPIVCPCQLSVVSLHYNTITKKQFIMRKNGKVDAGHYVTPCQARCDIIYAFSALMAFRTARTVTPTSAKTASHMVASPTTASSRTATFTPMAKTMF